MGVFGSSYTALGMTHPQEAYLACSAVALNIYNSVGTSTIKFAAAGLDEMMRIQSPGYVGIGMADMTLSGFTYPKGYPPNYPAYMLHLFSNAVGNHPTVAMETANISGQPGVAWKNASAAWNLYLQPSDNSIRLYYGPSAIDFIAFTALGSVRVGQMPNSSAIAGTVLPWVSVQPWAVPPSTAPETSAPFHAFGAARIAGGDGYGRINFKYNWYVSSLGATYLTSTEAGASFIQWHTGSHGGSFNFSYAPPGTAGTVVSFTQIVGIDGGASIWFSPRGTSTDFLIDTTGKVTLGSGQGMVISPSVGIPSPVTNLLYNMGGTLYWNGQMLGGWITSTGDANYIPVFTTSTNIGDSLLMQVNNKIGLGTANPQATFHIVSNDPVTTQLRIQNTNSTGRAALDMISGPNQYEFQIYVDTANNWNLFDVSANKYRIQITPAGYMAFGLNLPSYPYHIGSSYYSTSPPSETRYSAGPMVSFDCFNQVELTFGWYGIAPFPWWLQTRGNGGIAYPISLNPSGGNIGVGTLNPRAQLHVSGAMAVDFQATGDLIAHIRLVPPQTSGTTSCIIRNDGTSTYFLFTAVNDYWGVWNALRPFYINNTTGDVTIGSNLNVGNIVTANKLYLPSVGIPSPVTNLLYNMGGTLYWNGQMLGGWITSTGTANYIPVFTTSTNIGSSLMMQWNNNIGLGTGNPQALFHMVSNDPVTTQLRIQNTNSTGRAVLGMLGGQNQYEFQIFIDTANNWNLFDIPRGAYAIQVTSSGQVGIGLNLPAATVHVFTSAAQSNTQVLIQNNSDGTGTGNGTAAVCLKTTRQWNITSGGRGTAYDGLFFINDASANAIRMVINAAGNVGVGTTSPFCRLSCGQGLAPIKIASWDDGTGASCYGIGVDNSTLTFGAGINPVSGVPQMVMLSNGFVGIGNTNPGYKLDILSGRIRVVQNANDPWGLGFQYPNAYGGWIGCTSDQAMVFGNWGGVETARFTQGNQFGIGTGAAIDGGSIMHINSAGGYTQLRIQNTLVGGQPIVSYVDSGNWVWLTGIGPNTHSYMVYDYTQSRQRILIPPTDSVNLPGNWGGPNTTIASMALKLSGGWGGGLAFNDHAGGRDIALWSAGGTLMVSGMPEGGGIPTYASGTLGVGSLYVATRIGFPYIQTPTGSWLNIPTTTTHYLQIYDYNGNYVGWVPVF
jgi:hypothetical protein